MRSSNESGLLGFEIAIWPIFDFWGIQRPNFEKLKGYFHSLASKRIIAGIVVRFLHHVHQLHDVCNFVPMRLFGEKAAWVHQVHDTEQLNLFNMMIGLTHHEEQT